MRNAAWLVAAGSLILAGCNGLQAESPELEVARAHVNTQVEDVLDQADPADPEAARDVYAEDAATLRRGPNGLHVSVQMPTPQPGTYNYPEPNEPTVSEPGHPEAFTLWVFVFDDELGPFGDFPWSSAFLGAGHVVGGPNLTLSGHISKQSEPFAGFDLENPQDVEVHLAVAPHGGLDPEILPEQIKTPAGSPPLWWVALFETP